MTWTAYLPPTLQLPMLYFAMAVCVATVTALKTLPSNYRLPWIIQLVTLIVGCLTMLGLMGAKSLVYSLGSGAICASLSTTFYDLALSAIESRVRAFLGSSPPSSPPSVTPTAVRGIDLNQK
jgi:hypothetical protein